MHYIKPKNLMMKKTKEVSFNYRGKKFRIKTKNCNNFEKIIGLMFKSRKKAEVLLFEFKEQTQLKIHSFFVFFSFVAIWLDKKNKVVEIKKIKPFTVAVCPKKFYRRLIEIPINEKYAEKIKALGFPRR